MIRRGWFDRIDIEQRARSSGEQRERPERKWSCVLYTLDERIKSSFHRPPRSNGERRLRRVIPLLLHLLHLRNDLNHLDLRDDNLLHDLLLLIHMHVRPRARGRSSFGQRGGRSGGLGLDLGQDRTGRVVAGVGGRSALGLFDAVKGVNLGYREGGGKGRTRAG